jgi:uncharacterized membrane protein YhaH (DUF805 family)
MDLETIKFGLMLTIIPFTVIFLVITIWWAVVDMAARKLRGTQRTFWTIMVVLFPPMGAVAYYLAKRGDALQHVTFQQG